VSKDVPRKFHSALMTFYVRVQMFAVPLPTEMIAKRILIMIPTAKNRVRIFRDVTAEVKAQSVK